MDDDVDDAFQINTRRHRRLPMYLKQPLKTLHDDGRITGSLDDVELSITN